MRELILTFLASILAGFALFYMPTLSFLSFLTPVFEIIGGLAIIIFSLALLWKGVMSLLGKS